MRIIEVIIDSGIGSEQSSIIKEIMEISRHVNSAVASYTSDIHMPPSLYLSQSLGVSSPINRM